MSTFEIPADQIRQMQAVGLDMALFFDAFCTKHNLTYFLCGGCCIGAIRNGGFIPWDDDVDVFMPREDYEKLKRLWVDTDEYAIQYPTERLCTANQFLTICASNTTFIKTYQKDLDINHGVVLDVLPLDGCPQGWRRKTQKLWALAYSLFVVGKAPGNHGRGVRLIGALVLALVPSLSLRTKIWRLCERKMRQYPISQCSHVTELCSGPHYMQNEYPASVFSGTVRVEFEGHLLPVPVGYDTYLTMAFGDYRKLPPPEQRICHHEYEFLDMQHSYRVYRGTKYLTRPSKSGKSTPTPPAGGIQP